MQTTILDIFREENGNICYLSKATLNEYIKSLPSDYDSYDIQREIVNHIYLDNLINSLLEGKHIPPIVLIINNGQDFVVGQKIKITDFKILDGLQRTFRLKYLYDTIQFFLGKNLDDDFLSKTKFQLSKEYKKELFKINSNVGILSRLIEYAKDNPTYTEKYKSIFNRDQWFEIWQNLKPQDEVNKMLILNAGHKSVSPKHQLELLFSIALPTLQKLSKQAEGTFKIVREKEKSSIKFSKERQLGEFHFAHLITGILSFYEGNPLTINSNLIQNQQNDNDNKNHEIFFNAEFLEILINSLLELDQKLVEDNPGQGLKWFGREVSTVGLLGALGKYKVSNNLSDSEIFKRFQDLIVNNVSILNIEGFEKARNQVDLSKVNIGNVNKQAVYNVTLDILNKKETSPINWGKYFPGGRDDE